MSDDVWIVQIIEDATGKVEYESKPTYRKRAEKIEDGVGINLNWAAFSTRIINIEQREEAA